jgi:c-di-AMP phosphodiesterase-like protein
MNDDKLENKINQALNRTKIPQEKLIMGSINDKYPVVMDDGRTIIYISDKSKEAETRRKYELLKDKKYPTRNPKHHS